MAAELFILHIVLVLSKNDSEEKAGKAENLNSAAAFKLSYEKAVCFLEPSINLQLFYICQFLPQSF